MLPSLMNRLIPGSVSNAHQPLIEQCSPVRRVIGVIRALRLVFARTLFFKTTSPIIFSQEKLMNECKHLAVSFRSLQSFSLVTR